MKVVMMWTRTISAFLVVSGLTVSAANPETRLTFYQDEIKGRSSGVYEKDDDLYVHVRIPHSRMSQPGQLKLKAVLEANELLKRWAIDYSAAAREKAEAGSEGVKFAAKIADSFNPMWRFNDWNVKINGREVVYREKGDLLLGQIVSKADVVKQIPPSFTEAIPREVLFNVLPLLISSMREKDKRKLYGQCNAFDLMPDAVVSAKAKEECFWVKGEVDRYLANSDLPKSLRMKSKMVRGPAVTVMWTPLAQNPKTEVLKSVVTITNALADTTVSTNIIVRAQTDEERRERGVSAEGEMEEMICSSDEEEIVETTTVTSVTTRRTIRRKVTKSTSGHPAFEEAFLSGGRTLCTESAVQKERGDYAVSVFFDNVTPMEGKERIIIETLCENPCDARLWNLYGRCLLKKEDVIGALVCFRCAVRLDTKNQYAITNLSLSYERLGCLELARGMAVLAFGIATDDWCRTVARELICR